MDVVRVLYIAALIIVILVGLTWLDIIHIR